MSIQPADRQNPRVDKALSRCLCTDGHGRRAEREDGLARLRMSRALNDKAELRAAWFRAFAVEARERSDAWCTSIPNSDVVTIETTIRSPWPAEPRERGYPLEEDEPRDGQRIIGHGVREIVMVNRGRIGSAVCRRRGRHGRLTMSALSRRSGIVSERLSAWGCPPNQHHCRDHGRRREHGEDGALGEYGGCVRHQHWSSSPVAIGGALQIVCREHRRGAE